MQLNLVVSSKEEAWAVDWAFQHYLKKWENMPKSEAQQKKVSVIKGLHWQAIEILNHFLKITLNPGEKQCNI